MGEHTHDWINPWGYGSGTVPPHCPDDACQVGGAHVSFFCACGAQMVACPVGGEKVTEPDERDALES